MTRDELLSLAQRLSYGSRDPATGALLSSGLPSMASIEDVEAAARYLRACAEAEPVATVRVHDTGGNAGVEAVEALHGVASEHDIGYAAGWRACADEATRIVASHIDRLEPGKQLRTRDALLYLLASMRSILVSQRAAKETSR